MVSILISLDSEVYMKKIDMHHKSCQDLEKLIDKLSQTDEIITVVTGKGTGALMNKLKDLSRVYNFRLVNPTDNGTEFVCDFS